MQTEMMQAERWQRVEELYHVALEREPEEHEAFLLEARAGDDARSASVIPDYCNRLILCPALGWPLNTWTQLWLCVSHTS